MSGLMTGIVAWFGAGLTAPEFWRDLSAYVTEKDVYQKAIWSFGTLLIGFLWGLLSTLRARRMKYDPEKDARRSPHYFRGMHALMTKDWDTAARELAKVVDVSSEPVEVYLMLGNLYRDRGNAEKAIRIHQAILLRQELTDEEKSLALNALGADYMEAGMLDRAVATYQQALTIHRRDPNALRQLERLFEETGDWEQAYAMERRIQGLKPAEDRRTIAHLLIEKGKAHQKAGSNWRAMLAYRRALRLSNDAPAAALHLARLYAEGGKPGPCAESLRLFCERAPDKAHAALPELEGVMDALGQDFGAFLEKLQAARPNRHLLAYCIQRHVKRGEMDAARRLVAEGLQRFPASGLLLRQYWSLEAPAGALKERFSADARLNDEYHCAECRYRTLDVLWRCPNCKAWNPFGEPLP